ncbi:putative lyase [Novipirellula aureliae]|uniref:Putative lyase n=1 Tax=Novipirellula aureliae TaxID=2527966 RepID=A0A5C6E7A4_9BACT|nr:HEAT repeat domain-containing protein [Novipirellula aureliae]TWU43541.1 putative lyase [Novipirellula aureliae]
MNFSLRSNDGSCSTCLSRVLVLLVLWSLFSINVSAIANGQDAVETEAFAKAIKDLNDGSAKVRDAAASKLGQLRLNPKVSVLALTLALKDDDMRVRSSAAQSLGKFGGDAKFAAAFLIQAVEKINRRRDAVGDSVEAKAAYPAAQDVISDGFTFTSKETLFLSHCIDALGKIEADPDTVVPVLMHALKNDDEVVRAAAAFAMGNIGADAKDAITPLIAALRDESPAVRLRATTAFWNFGPVASSAVPALTKSLEDDSIMVRIRAAVALHKVAPEGPNEAAVQALIDTMGDHDWRFRKEATYAFTKIDPDKVTPDAVAALRDAQTDAHEQVRDIATLTLRQIGSLKTADDQSK